MLYSITIHVGTFTNKAGKQKIVVVHTDRGYVWDSVFEEINRRFPRKDVFANCKTRGKCRAIAKKLGYDVRPGIGTYATP